GFRAGGKASATQVPALAGGLRGMKLWRSWSPETRGSVGTLTTAPFKPSRFMAIPFHGNPGERPGQRIYLRCVATGLERDVATIRVIAAWSTAYIKPPRDFCRGDVQLVATAATPDRVVGVGTPLRISAAAYYAQTTFPPRALVVAGAWAILVSLLAAFAWAGGRLVPSVDRLAAGFCGLGLAGMALFLVTHFSAEAGRILATLLSVAGIAGVALMAARDRPTLRSLAATHGRGAVIWLAVALTFAAFWGAADNGGGSWAINGLFSPVRWSTDNQLPFLFAEALDTDVARETIRFGNWLASDRTPLLTTLYLLLRPLVIAPVVDGVGKTFTATAYMLAGTVILTSWVPILAHLSRVVLRRDGGLLVLLAAISPFFVFNSVYAWGKLLGGTYIMLAALLLLLMRRENTRNGPALAAVAVSVALAYLSHGSNGFAALGLALAFAATIWRQGALRIALGTVAALATAAPWLWWQSAIQPGGDALIRSALTGIGDAQVRNVPLLRSIAKAYRGLGVDGLIARKIEAIRIIFGVAPAGSGESAIFFAGNRVVGEARLRDFFLPARSLGFPAVAGLAMLVTALFRPANRRPVLLSEPGMLALAGALGLLVTLVIALNRPIVLGTGYGSIALLFAGGAMALIASGRAATLTATAIAGVYFLAVWVVSPLSGALRIEWSNLA
ncbi:MAG TPA: hypothetical protein PKA74_00780, partial [Bauldia sp.]|nr:hypothetical protein [Bauldia sp.]